MSSKLSGAQNRKRKAKALNEQKASAKVMCNFLSRPRDCNSTQETEPQPSFISLDVDTEAKEEEECVRVTEDSGETSKKTPTEDLSDHTNTIPLNENDLNDIGPVSYTHLDVYKRQT